MKKKWTRRRFLATGVTSSLVVGSGAVSGVSASAFAAIGKVGAPLAPLSSAETETLKGAMDEIIPAADGMPAASAVGGVEYLVRLSSQIPSIRRDLQKSLAALEALCRKKSGASFASLAHNQRIEALQALEKQPSAETFALLRDFTYEAYYTQPQIWKLIGYECHPTDQAGPRMKPFDESVLAQVKKMPKLYREVS